MWARSKYQSDDRGAGITIHPWSRTWAWLLFGVLGVLGLALWLRWHYVQGVGLYVDEYTTLWASWQILERGAPIMPSGVLYPRGILYSYVAAAFAAMGGLTYTAGRLPSVLFGLGAIGLIFWIGQREWHSRVGWLAAVGLALLPEAIEASSRVRFYAQLLFFVLLTVWAAYRTTQIDPTDPRRAHRAHLIFAACFTLALFSQEGTILLYPSLIAAIWWWQGHAFWRQRAVWLGQALCGVALLARYGIEQLGQPGYLDSIQSHKPYLSLFSDVGGAWQEYGALLIEGARLPWTLGALLALSVALILVARVGWRPARLPAFHQATLFFGLQFLFVLIVLLTAVDWREDRYILMVQSCWLLVGAAGLVWAVEQLLPQPAWRWAATIGVSLLLAGWLWPAATALLALQPEGYDEAFGYIAAHHQPGDSVISPQPPACAVVLRRPCDHFARQRGYEPYVVPQEGTLVDRWTGAPLLESAADLKRTVQRGRVWFVTDGRRLGERYEDDFIRMVVEQFRPVFEEREVMALLSDGWDEPPPYVIHETLETPVPFENLSLTAWERTVIQPGTKLNLMLLWRRTGFIGRQINTSVQFVASDGQRLTQADGPPAKGMISTTDRTNAKLPDPKQLAIPPDLPPGRYRLEAIAYDVNTQIPLAPPHPLDWVWVGPPPPTPTHPITVRWNQGITLLGHDTLPPTLSPGATLPLRLIWTSNGAVPADYTMFVHLLDPQGQIVAQSDQAPENGFYPTSRWHAVDPVTASHQLILPATLSPGPYRLLVGWYNPQTGARLPLPAGADAFELAHWEIPG